MKLDLCSFSQLDLLLSPMQAFCCRAPPFNSQEPKSKNQNTTNKHEIENPVTWLGEMGKEEKFPSLKLLHSACTNFNRFTFQPVKIRYI